jgi:hypothetical protein
MPKSETKLRPGDPERPPLAVLRMGRMFRPIETVGGDIPDLGDVLVVEAEVVEEQLRKKIESWVFVQDRFRPLYCGPRQHELRINWSTARVTLLMYQNEYETNLPSNSSPPPVTPAARAGCILAPPPSSALGLRPTVQALASPASLSSGPIEGPCSLSGHSLAPPP